MVANPLTPVLHYETQLPAPGSVEAGQVKVDPARKVAVDVCSEFMEYSAAVSALEAQKKIVVARDSKGRPIIFGFDTSMRLFAIVHVEGGPEAWQRIDVSPTGSDQVELFDIRQSSSGGQLLLAALVKENGDDYRIWHARWSFPDLHWNTKTQSISGFNKQDVGWTRTANNYGNLSVSSVSICQSQDDVGNDSYHVVIGTRRTAEKTGAHYYMTHKTFTGDQPWQFFTLSASAKTIINVTPGAVQDGPGAFTLFKRPGTSTGADDGSVGCVFDKFDSQIHYEIDIGSLGQVNNLWANGNVVGLTDLFIAGEKGLGFYRYDIPDDEPQILLPDISFKDVTTSEAVADDKTSRIVVFALSVRADLYYLEADRDLRTGAVTFRASGFPIRKNVEQISAQYNSSSNASELIYLGNATNEIVHLARDPNNNMWAEQNIKIQLTNKKKSHPAHVTTITVTDDNRIPLADYPCKLTADYAFVMINGRTHLLDKAPTEVMTDGSGKLNIVRYSNGCLSAPRYTLRLDYLSPSSPYSVDIEPAQRVLLGLAMLSQGLKNGQNVKDAVNSKGEKVFAASHKDDGDFELAGNVIQHFESMVRKVDPDSSKEILGAMTGTATDVTVAWDKNSSGEVKPADTNWLDDAIEGAREFFADVLEGMKLVFKTVARVAIKIVGPVVKLYIKIYGKIFHFILEAIGIVNFLGDLLDIDMSGFLNWLGFLFDIEQAKKTQKVLVDIMNNTMITSERFLRVNQAAMKTLFEQIRPLLQRFIRDNRKVVNDPFDNDVTGPFSMLADLINNPVFGFLWQYTPLAAFLEVLEEETADSIQLPDISGFLDTLTSGVATLADAEIKIVTDLIKDILQKLGDWVKGSLTTDKLLDKLFGDAFWAIFDGVETGVCGALHIFAKAIAGFQTVLNGEIKLPVITEEWVDWAQQPLTFINMFTLIPAYILNLVHILDDGALPFENSPNLAATFLVDEKHLNIFTTLGHLFPTPMNLAWKAASSDTPSVAFNSTKMANFHVMAAENVDNFHPEAEKVDPEEAFEEYVGTDSWLCFAQRVLSATNVAVEGATSLMKSQPGPTGNEPRPEHKNDIEMKDMSTSPPSNRVKKKNHAITISLNRWLHQEHGGKHRKKVLESLEIWIHFTFDIFQLGFAIASVGLMFRNSELLGAKRFITSKDGQASYPGFKILNIGFKMFAIVVRFVERDFAKDSRDFIANFLSVAGSMGEAIFCGLVVDYGGMTSAQQNSQKGELVLSANMLEIGSQLFNLASSAVAVTVESTKNDEAAVFIPILSSFDLLCAIGGAATIGEGNKLSFPPE